MKNFVGHGDAITVDAPADVVAGGVYQGDTKIGVYQHDALTGEPVSVWVRGEFELPVTGVLTGDALDGVDWDGSGIVVAGAVGVPNAGVLAETILTATTARVRIG